jgi:hypothetical protein
MSNIIEIMPDNMPSWMQEAMEVGQLAKVCMEKNETKKDYIIEQSGIIKKLRREKTELAKSRFELNERLLKRIAELKAGIKSVEELIDDSEGVYGLHLNGDGAPWCSLRTGGSFEEWLLDFDKAAQEAGE